MSRQPIILTLLALLLTLVSSTRTRAEEAMVDIRVLIVVSYNPDVYSMSYAVESFENRLRELNVNPDIAVVSLKSEDLEHAYQWQTRMSNILKDNIKDYNRPDAIITIGQEALASYLSLDPLKVPKVPVFCGMASRNYSDILWTECDTLDIDYTPDSHDVSEVAQLYNIVGGSFYEYDIPKNIELLKSLFPKTQSIAFLTDNSYGGVALKAHILKSLAGRRDFSFYWLDGRTMTFLNATDTLARMPYHSALMIGTWRYDCDNRFYNSSAFKMLDESSNNVPIMTLTSTGIDNCAIGGLVPNYQNIGRRLADAVVKYKETRELQIEYIPSHYLFCLPALERYDISTKVLPRGAEIFDPTPTIWEEYTKEIIIIVAIILMLITGLSVALYHLRRIRKLRNILERQRAELIVAKNNAETNSHLKSYYLAEMSHEVRTPLNAVVGFSQVLANKENTLSEKERNTISDIVGKNSNHLIKLIDGILDISRIESGRAKYTFEDVDLVEICQLTLVSIQAAQGSACQLFFKFETDLKNCPFITDRQRIQQVILNLLTNSVKFTRTGGITLSLERDHEGVKISVTDTGIGVPSDKAETIFSRFVKLDESANGTGLGLSLCRTIIERLGGKIWLDPSYTTGSRFIFTLPFDGANG